MESQGALRPVPGRAEYCTGVTANATTVIAIVTTTIYLSAGFSVSTASRSNVTSQRSIPTYLFETAIPSVCICIRNIQYVPSLASAFLLANVSPAKQDSCSAPHRGCCRQQSLPGVINAHPGGGFHTTLGLRQVAHCQPQKPAPHQALPHRLFVSKMGLGSQVVLN